MKEYINQRNNVEYGIVFIEQQLFLSVAKEKGRVMKEGIMRLQRLKNTIPLSEIQLNLAVSLYLVKPKYAFGNQRGVIKNKSSEKLMYLKMWQIIDAENPV